MGTARSVYQVTHGRVETTPTVRLSTAMMYKTHENEQIITGAAVAWPVGAAWHVDWRPLHVAALQARLVGCTPSAKGRGWETPSPAAASAQQRMVVVTTTRGVFVIPSTRTARAAISSECLVVSLCATLGGCFAAVGRGCPPRSGSARRPCGAISGAPVWFCGGRRRFCGDTPSCASTKTRTMLRCISMVARAAARTLGGGGGTHGSPVLGCARGVAGALRRVGVPEGAAAWGVAPACITMQGES